MDSTGHYHDLPQEIQDLDEWCLRHMAYWGEQAQRPESIVGAPGSVVQISRQDLESQDDDPLLEINLAVLAWRSLASAGEHAGLAHWLHQSTGGGVVPRPQMSLARAAMLGAARAIYLLQPDDETERSLRAARLANQEVKDARDYLTVYASIQGDHGQGVIDLRGYFDAVKAAAEKVLTDVGNKPDSHMDDTALLKKAAPVLADGSEHPELAVMSAWRKGSAVAHGRSWIWGALPDHAHPAEKFVTVWSVPVGLMGHAWVLWNLRRGLDNPPAYPPAGWEMDPAFQYDVAEAPEGE